MDSDIAINIGVVFLLLFVSAFFSGSETGLTGASRAKIYKLKNEGNKKARKVIRLREDKENLIGAILFGNNVVNILASSLAAGVMIELFGKEGIFYATAVMTVLVLIFAEVLPKTYAIQNSERVALWVAPIFIYLVKIFSPITRFVQFLVNICLNMLSRKKEDDEHAVSGADALRGAIEMHHDEGSVIKEDKDMLGSILDLPNLDVSKVMVHRKNMSTIDITTPPDELMQKVLESNYTRIPLWKDNPDNIVGILHVKNLLRILQTGKKIGTDIPIEEVTYDPWFVLENTPLSKQLHAFREKQTHFALVVDEYGALQGLVTLEDVLEEIVGDIIDEHDADEKHLVEEKDDWYVVNGTLPIRDVNRQLGWSLPENEATTIAGLIIHEAGNIPERGESFEYYHTLFEVRAKDRNQITKIALKQLENNDPEDD